MAFLQKADVELEKIKVRMDTKEAKCYPTIMNSSMLLQRTTCEEELQGHINNHVAFLSSLLSSQPIGMTFLGKIQWPKIQSPLQLLALIPKWI